MKMFASIAATFSLLAILVAIGCRLLNWVWFRPKRMEKALRKQGLKGNSYRFLFGDAKETANMYEESYSKPIGISDDITPRESFMWVGPRPLVFIMDAELMKVVMNKHTSFQKPFKTSNPIFKRLIGGVIRYEGEKWSQNRKKLNTLFHLDRLKGMVATMQSECEKILDEWSNIVPKDGSPGEVDVFPYLPDYTGSVVSYTLFSTRFTTAVKRTFNIISELTLVANQAQPFSIPGEQYLPTKKYRRANAIENELTATFTNMMHERLHKRETGEISGQEPDLFDRFLDELNEVDIRDGRAHAMVVHDVIQQCKLFFVAGYQTTSNLVAWTIIMLVVHQDWQARAREEVFQVLGNKSKIDADDLGKLKILNMIVHEVLRLYPPSVEVTSTSAEKSI
ncbi:hypothetical protein CASFOL_036737 [Castilleja foliolosa]|uniref:Cytochrome P450 n=1 Tax=Castilleja foliolosa TaxID=1961234 RepID=A0ABD3BPH7_9LAMI